MNALLQSPRVTPDDLLKNPDLRGFELDDGRLVEKGATLLTSWVAARCLERLGRQGDAHLVGLVLSAVATYRCFPSWPDNVRRPDFSFIRPGRVGRAAFEQGHSRVAPDLVGEVVSPTDLYYEMTRRIQLYLEAGTRLMWIVNPLDQTVLVYRADGSIVGFRTGQELSGEAVLPGFTCPVRDLFPPTELLALLGDAPVDESEE